MIKKIILFLVACTVSGVAPLIAQLRPGGNKKSEHFIFPGLQMTLTNNFIINPACKYSPGYFSIPFKNGLIEVYGKLLSFSVFQLNDQLQFADYSGSFLYDTVLADKPYFEISRLEARISRNGSILRDWKPVMLMSSFIDSAINYKADPQKFQIGYKVLNDSLEVGDSISVEFRSGNGPLLLKFTMIRKDAYTRPFLMASAHDSNSAIIDYLRFRNAQTQTSPEVSSFLRERIQKIILSREIFNREDYQDWPVLAGSTDLGEYKAGEKAIFNFRREKRDGKNAMFLYRLLGRTHSDTAWKQTDGLIYSPLLQENTQYRLEVKYADGHGDLAVYTFFTAPGWYQTTLFKVLLLVLAVTLAALMITLILAQKKKYRQHKQELELQSLYSQINPHFVFNALGSIQGLINDNRIDLANQYLSGFASLLRTSITDGRKLLVGMQSELNALSNYIQLEKLRSDFNYNFEIDKEINISTIEMPPLLIQPIIENAIKHGLNGRRGSLSFSVQKDNNHLLLIVTDDGDGFDLSNAASGHGILLTRQRIALINRIQRGRMITLEINSSPKGTKAVMKFSNWLTND